MNSYKLTKRGKFVLFTLCMIIVSSSYIKEDIVLANDNSKDNTSSIGQDGINSNEELILLSNEIKQSRKEIHINNNEGFLSVKVEDIHLINKKIAFLTFDDGPSHNVTPSVLDTLENYDIKATFFVLGIMAEKNSNILKRISDSGHSIGIHSYSHETNKLLKSKEDFLYDLDISDKVIKHIIGDDFTTRLYRFPGGSFEYNKRQYLNDLNEAGYVNVDWNALTGDAEHMNPEPEKLLETLKETIINKDKIIVLMHDATTKKVTADILPDVIEFLKSEGYEFALLK